MAVSTRLPRLQFCIFLDSAYPRICSAPHILGFGLTTTVRFPHFGPKVCVAPDPGKRAAYSSSAVQESFCSVYPMLSTYQNIVIFHFCKRGIDGAFE